MARWRAELRADLMEVYGVDLAEAVAGNRWVMILDLIDQLPARSRFHQAQMDDPETAALLLELADAENEKDEQEPWSPPWREFGTTEVLLQQLINSVHLVAANVQSAAGVKKPNVPDPFPSPVTGIDRARKRRDTEHAQEQLEAFGF